MNWLLLNSVPLINIVGIVCDIVGAFFVAYEVVRQFHGAKYVGTATLNFSRSMSSSPPPKETAEYTLWDRRRSKNMKIGLTLLVFGFGLQVLANVMQLKNAG
jgi:hypothetical protein